MADALDALAEAPLLPNIYRGHIVSNQDNNMPDRRDRPSANQATPPVVVADPEIMGGWACFVGTRVPASMVIGMVDSGAPWSQLVADYPFLTEAHVVAARAYLAAPEEPGKEPTNWLGIASTGSDRKVLRPARRGANPSSDE